MVPLEPAGPLRPLSAFLYKLIVLVTVSRLWLGITYHTSLGISEVQQDPPRWTPVGFGSKAGQAHLPYNAQTTVCVTQWQRAGVLSSSSPCLHVARSPAVLRGPGRDAATAVMVHRTRAGPCGQSRGRNPNVLGQHRGKTIVWNSKLSLY